MMTKWRRLALCLEWSCHGIPWLFFSVSWVSLLWWHPTDFYSPLALFLSDIASSLQSLFPEGISSLFSDQWIKAVCLLFALLLDICAVGIIKCCVRRSRPEGSRIEDMKLTVPQDAWSFPSGHASRSALLFWLLPRMFHFNSWMFLLLLSWTIAVCLSRYTMKRHHLSDVIAGFVLGSLEYYIVISIPWPLLFWLPNVP
ncbi:unnamed protein product [Dicrocoelium dendriticum]|nr:unnamed protein product [Dicrocoelium dendriticum]